jgi:hypothetical protein
MLVEHVLDVAREDLVTAGVDHVLEPVDDEQPPVLGLLADVSGVQPPPADRVADSSRSCQ